MNNEIKNALETLKLQFGHDTSAMSNIYTEEVKALQIIESALNNKKTVRLEELEKICEEKGFPIKWRTEILVASGPITNKLVVHYDMDIKKIIEQSIDKVKEL